MDTLYYNMKPALRLHIRPREVETPNQLIQRVKVIGEILYQLAKEQRTDPTQQLKPKQLSAANPNYKREEC